MQSNGKFMLIDGGEESGIKNLEKMIRTGYLSTFKDFTLSAIIMTHSHSDHIGGYPYLVNTVKNKNGKPVVNSNTTVYYKTYNTSVGGKAIDDINQEPKEWDNLGFYKRAEYALNQTGCKFKEVTKSKMTDTVSFEFEDFSVTLYNLVNHLKTREAVEENSNSIVAFLQKTRNNGIKIASPTIDIYLAGDLTALYLDQEKTTLDEYVAGQITQKLNDGKVEVFKYNHHGSANGNSTKNAIDMYRPVYGVTTSEHNMVKVPAMYSAARWNTVNYAMGDPSKAATYFRIPDNSSKVVPYYVLNNSTREYKYTRLTSTKWDDSGWAQWIQVGRDFASDGYLTTSNYEEIDYAYRENGIYIKNKWKKIDGSWYYLDENGISAKGWKEIYSKWYFFDAQGRMKTGR